VTGVQFIVDLRRQELIGVQARGNYDAQELAMDAWGGKVALRGPHRP
jgi:hypothetical protein